MLNPAGGNRIATAAKVAAKVAPNVVTGGVVAEAGPRPDFSLWTVEDDLLLENAMEVRICRKRYYAVFNYDSLCNQLYSPSH